jgi:aspartate kinase
MLKPTPSPCGEVPRASGVTLSLHLAKVGVMSVPDRPGIAGAVVGALAARGIAVQFVVETTDLNNRSHIVFCVEEALLAESLAAVDDVAGEIQAEKVISQPGVAMVSVYGPHFRERPGCAAAAFQTLAGAGINILAIATSVSSISCLVEAKAVDIAVRALAEAFGVSDSALLVYAEGLSKPWKPGSDQ